MLSIGVRLVGHADNVEDTKPVVCFVYADWWNFSLLAETRGTTSYYAYGELSFFLCVFAFSTPNHHHREKAQQQNRRRALWRTHLREERAAQERRDFLAEVIDWGINAMEFLSLLPRSGRLLIISENHRSYVAINSYDIIRTG